jgi:hypothetical protein
MEACRKFYGRAIERKKKGSLWKVPPFPPVIPFTVDSAPWRPLFLTPFPLTPLPRPSPPLFHFSLPSTPPPTLSSSLDIPRHFPHPLPHPLPHLPFLNRHLLPLDFLSHHLTLSATSPSPMLFKQQRPTSDSKRISSPSSPLPCPRRGSRPGQIRNGKSGRRLLGRS